MPLDLKNKIFLVFIASFLVSSFAWSADAETTNLILRIGNESNPVDGILGPLTYGLLANHTFENQMAIEASYIRLHEPDTSLKLSVLDEGQLTAKSPETKVFGESFILGVTAWKNRTIAMYTEVVGVELTRTSEYSFSLGLYSGTASLEELSKRFNGGQLGLASSFGPIDISATYMAGQIESGSYRKLALEGSADLLQTANFPLTLTFGIEDRYFNFGDGGPESDPRDEYIYVTGIEIHFAQALGF